MGEMSQWAGAAPVDEVKLPVSLLKSAILSLHSNTQSFYFNILIARFL